MGLQVKHKLMYYRIYDLDIWGVMKSTLMLRDCYFETKEALIRLNYAFPEDIIEAFFIKKPSAKISHICEYFLDKYFFKIEKYFNKKRRYIYRIDVISPEKLKKRLTKKFASIRLLKLFYLVLKYKQFKKMARKAKGKSGFFESNYLMLLEGRIVCIIYRASFLSNMFQALRFVQKKIIWIDKLIVKFINTITPVMKFIGFRIIFKGSIYWSLVRRTVKKINLFGIPKFLFLSFAFLTFFLKRAPKEKDLINPIHLNIFRATGYYH